VALAALAETYPSTRTQLRHLSTAAQLTVLRAGELDLGLLREHPVGEEFDAVLVVEERLGVLLATELGRKIATPAGVRLNALAGLNWLSFPGSGSPAWYDELTAVMRSHGLDPGPAAPEGQSLIPEVKLATVGAGGAFAFAPPDWPVTFPETVMWCPLVGHPVVRRTGAVWRADSHRRDLGHLVAALPTP
jgi:LysR substrate binding domain